TATGTNSTSAMIAAVRTLGNISTRKLKVSVSMTIRSMKLSVIQSTSYLNRDTTISVTSSANDSAADSAGRRSSTSQKQLTSAQLSTNTLIATASISLQSMMASAATWNAAAGTIRPIRSCASASGSVSRLAIDVSRGGMRQAPAL